MADGLFVGGEAVAKSIEILRQSGITHVVNCVGFIYPEYFKDELTYRTLRLQGAPLSPFACPTEKPLQPPIGIASLSSPSTPLSFPSNCPHIAALRHS